MSVAVKICGLTNAHTAAVAARAGARFLGFVCYPGSPRNVTPEQARAILDTLPRENRPEAAALTVGAGDDVLATIVAKARPDWLQLHGTESPERVREIKERFGKPVIKAVPVAGPADLSRAMAYEDIADMLLFDAKAPEGTELPGGNGLAFDHGILKTCNIRTPWFLAGGLTPETVAAALCVSSAQFVDVSSGVEAERGVKSPALIEAFVAAAHGAETAAQLNVKG